MPHGEPGWPRARALRAPLTHPRPVVERVWTAALRLWAALQPYHPLDLGGVAFGLCCAFFGAHYVLLLAAVEAARLTGYAKFQGHFTVLWTNYQSVHKQNLLDNLRDDDRNGKADVEELSRQELFTRKWKLFLRTVDPQELTDALHGLVIIFFSIVATLRVQFVRGEVVAGEGVGFSDVCV